MRWILACAIGEAIGIAVVSLGYALGDRVFPEITAWLIIAAGAIEGLSLGAAQAAAGRKWGIRAAPWIAATVFAALAGYGLSLVGQGAFSGGESLPQADEPSVILIAAAGAVLGAFMGLLFGAAQSLVLPVGLSRRGWIIRNMIGWTLAMAAIMVAASAAGADWPFWRVSALGAVSGALAGLALGVATRGALQERRIAG